MSPFAIVLVAALAMLALASWRLVALRRNLRGRRLGVVRQSMVVASLLLAGLVLGVLALSLFHFQRLLEEEVVARMEVQQLAPQRFLVTLATTTESASVFELRGDQWQLDARVLRWQLPALLGGAPNLYRLERISGRYLDIRQEREASRSAHELADDAFPDLWTLRRQFPRWLPFVDADYGSAAYLPLLDGARYDVSLGPRGGLVARPADAQSEALLKAAGW